MSNYIKDSYGNDVHTNYMKGLTIGDYNFEWKEFLPVFLHYLQGGLGGHNSSMLSEENLKALDDFVNEIKVSKKMNFNDITEQYDKDMENNFYYTDPKFNNEKCKRNKFEFMRDNDDKNNSSK